MTTSFTVYILECSDKTLYTGCTNNLNKRLVEHNNRKSGAHYTKTRRPVTLVYKEEFTTLLEARRREAHLKKWSKKKKSSLFKNKLAA